MNFPFDWKDIFTVSMILFAIIDVIGAVPVVINLRKQVGHINSGKASIAAMLLMIVFLFAGEQLLKLIGVDVASFAIAGSLVITFISFEMILGIRIYRVDVPQTASIVPIAFPLIAGTGTLTTLLALRSKYYVGDIIVAILLNTIFVYIVLKSTKTIERVLGTGGISVLRRVFGVILLAIAVKLFKTNLGI